MIIINRYIVELYDNKSDSIIIKSAITTASSELEAIEKTRHLEW